MREKTIDKIFEKNSSFLCEIVHYGKFSISIFQELFASIKKNFRLGGGLGARLIFYEFLRFS